MIDVECYELFVKRIFIDLYHCILVILVYLMWVVEVLIHLEYKSEMRRRIEMKLCTRVDTNMGAALLCIDFGWSAKTHPFM